MSRVNPLTLAEWVIPRWDGQLDRTRAVAAAMAAGADPNAPQGAWGVGGPSGDGPAQADVAYGVWREKGWNGIPAFKTGAAALYSPIAAAAVAERLAQGGFETVVKGAKDTVTGVTGTASGVATGLGDTFAVVRWLTTPGAWNRILKIAIGGGMVWLGAAVMAKRTALDPFINVLTGTDDRVAAQAQLAK